MTTEELGQACMDARPMVFRAVRNFRTLDREDIFQDACLRALSSSAKFDGRSQFSTWFVRVAINCALMQLRRDKHHHPTTVYDVPVYESDGYDFRTRPRKDNPLECVLDQERSDALLIAMAGLTVRQRDLVQRRYFEEKTYKEVGLELGIQGGAVKSQIHRKRRGADGWHVGGGALARLRESLIA